MAGGGEETPYGFDREEQCPLAVDSIKLNAENFDTSETKY